MAEPGRVLLVDTTGFLFRAFHALRDTIAMKRDDGHPTGAIYVTVQMLMRVLQKHPADGVVCVMDAKGKTFRHEMYPEYKANRPPIDPDLAQQIEPLKRFISAMGLKLACVSGVEADDVIATLHAQARAAGMHVTISSADKDLMQLVDEHTRVVDNLRSEERSFGPEEVLAKFGVPPERIVDLLALTGDSSDNIKGVDKVGPKTAANWINRYGSLKDIIGRSKEIKGVVGENLRQAIERVRKNEDLVIARKDVELDFGLDDLAPVAPREQELRDLCDEYQLRFADRVLRALGHPGEAKAQAADEPRAPLQVDIIGDAAALAEWLRGRGQSLGLHVRYSRTGESPIDDEWDSVGIADGDDRRCWISLAEFGPEQSEAIFAALAASNATFAIHDSKRLLNGLGRRGLPVPGRVDDIGLASFVEHSQQDSSIAALGRRLLDANPPEPAPGAESDSRQRAEEDAWNASVAGLARDALRKRMSEEEWGVYENIDLPLVPVLSRMEQAGVLVDANQLAALAGDLTERMERIESDIYSLVGNAFNLGSPVQVAAVLFDELALPSLRKTQKGARSTDESVLGELAAREDLPEEKRRVAARILDHRACSKLLSTYVLRLPEWIHPETGRVHTHFLQTEAATGRLASSRPGLQNIPIRTEDGRRIRRAFVAPDGCALVSADYSQVELRLMAHMSGDRALLDAFRAGEDIHKSTAAEIFGVAPEAVDADQRRFAKSINFGLIYGMSEFGLAKQLGIARDEARSHMGRYFDRYPRVREFMDELRAQSESERHVRTLFGRRIHSPPARGHMARQAVQRAAINAPLQGTAADLIKKAMTEVDAWLAEQKMESRLLLQVHDELLLEVPFGELDAAREAAARIMSGVAQLDVPLVVNVSHGSNWDEAH